MIIENNLLEQVKNINDICNGNTDNNSTEKNINNKIINKTKLNQERLLFKIFKYKSILENVLKNRTSLPINKYIINLEQIDEVDELTDSDSLFNSKKIIQKSISDNNLIKNKNYSINFILILTIIFIFGLLYIIINRNKIKLNINLNNLIKNQV